MFTGIITDIGTVTAVEARADHRVTIATGYDIAGLALGASVACSGVCLTVVAAAPGRFSVDVSRETFAASAPDHFETGARLNLERALKVGDELGGHIVTGHVDGVAEVARTWPEGGSTGIELTVPRALGGYIAPKGSITVDGVSLTVNVVRDPADATHFTVNIIPHTAASTTLGGLAPGDRVNIEIDVLARYLMRLQSVAAA